MSLRRIIPLGLAGIILVGASNSLQTAAAQGETRTLSFHHLHTKESITVTFKRDGRYDSDALKKLDWFMRDWRKDESVKMDPQLFDVLWEANRHVGGTRPIEVICGYRAPGTNAMLRARSTGVAQNSNHTTGHAMDFAIPGVDLAKLREVGLRLQRGGVGFYPTSGSPFVHMDTGTVRHWPRMTRDQLARVFPDGRTVHVPSDGQPLANYAMALADVERRGGEVSNVSLAAARDAGVDTADNKPKRNFLASLFTAKQPEADEAADEEPVAAPKRMRTQTVLASAAPLPPQKPVSVQPPFAVASVDASAPLAYAAETPLPKPALRAKATPMGMAVASAPVPKLTTPVMPGAPTAVAFAVPFTPQLSSGVQTPGSPWLRAAMLASSVSAMSTHSMGEQHMRPLVDLMYKPAESLLMTFSDDPHHGVTTARFEGSAIVFLATATFTTQITASLR